MTGRLKIGISACHFHADPTRPIFKGKTLLYLEQSLARWVMAEGALAWLVPAPAEGSPVTLADYAAELDGLILHGGSDVSPRSYGEEPLRPEWAGDYIRDVYELALYREFRDHGKPVLGVCRGAQLLNVACGGTLYQDIPTQVPGAARHRDWDIYDRNHHDIQIEPGSILAEVVGKPTARVNSIHHQGLKTLGQGLRVEARSLPDGMIEAISLTDAPFVHAVQWHPEFHAEPGLLDPAPLLRRFLQHAQKRSSS